MVFRLRRRFVFAYGSVSMTQRPTGDGGANYRPCHFYKFTVNCPFVERPVITIISGNVEVRKLGTIIILLIGTGRSYKTRSPAAFGIQYSPTFRIVIPPIRSHFDEFPVDYAVECYTAGPHGRVSSSSPVLEFPVFASVADVRSI